ncbi:MAG TPA: ABC transporter permease [Terriglobia bacterium]|nr:ABC transporter permease [Terriglobia bacterium]
MNTLLNDIRFGLRMLRKNPGFSAIAIITLTLGIGANTAIFSVVSGVLLNPLPYPEPERLVAIYSKSPEFDRSSISYPNLLDWRRDNRSFTDIAGYRGNDVSLTGMGEPERLPAEMVSASFFPILGVKAALGRTFLVSEDQVGATPVVVISNGLWKRKFGSSPDTVGKAMTLNGKAYTVVGVLPADYRYIGNNYHRSDVFEPMGQWNDPSFLDRRISMGVNAVGRLKPGITFDQAKADMSVLASHLATAYPEADKGLGVTLIPLKENVVGRIQPFLLLLQAAVAFVLLIACVNVANLLLARSTGRTREFAIRAALGASQGRAIRQLLTESILLGLAGGSLGLLVASWGLKAALKALPDALPRAEDVHLDGRVLLFTLGAALLCGVLFGLVPAFKASQTDLHETLKEGGRGSSGARQRAQTVFVVLEMALALVLLAGGGLMVRSLAKLWRVNPGFSPKNALIFNLSYPLISAPPAIRESWLRIEGALEAIPGIDAASLTIGSVPMQGDSELPFWIEGQPKPATQNQMKSTLFYLVQPDYLKAMGIPLERGRFLRPQDNEHAPLVTVIDEQFARLYFGGQNPIGKRVNFELFNTSAEIVGVAGHVKQWGLDSDSSSPIQAQCYLALPQTPDQFLSLVNGSVGAVLRGSEPPEAQIGAVRRAMEHYNGQAVVYGVQTLGGIISDSLATQRFAMTLLGVFSVLALVMCCVGVYGVISYLASQRTREIGVRMALGARKQDVLRMVLREAGTVSLVGIGVGLVAALVLTRLMAKLIFGITAHDPLTFGAVTVLLMLVALAACFIPAWRASRVDPMRALRYE